MKIKSVLMFGLLLISLLAMSSLASAITVSNVEVEFDDDNLEQSSTNAIRSIDKGEEFEVKVRFTATQSVDDVEVAAWISGYDHSDRVSDTSDVFDVTENRTYVKKLKLGFPQRLDQDRYTLRVEISGRSGAPQLFTYELDVDADRHDVVIKDVILSPNNGVVAGRALLATVRVQNYGDVDEDDVRVTFRIPELGLSATDYIDELEADGDDDDQKSTEELYLRIPSHAKAGTYDAEVVVDFHDLERRVTKTLTVEVVEDKAHASMDAPSTVKGKTVISVGPESQSIAQGASVIYPVTVTNVGTAKTYTIGVTGGDWGAFSVSPTNVVTVGSDETKTVYIHAAAKENAPAGAQVLGVSIKDGDRVVKEVTLTANVVGGASGADSVSLKRALEIGLIVLVVILVILALVIGFNKLKGDDEDKEEGQSYY